MCFLSMFRKSYFYSMPNLARCQTRHAKIGTI
nr:MAG TPA: hypothetical protein [Caudoviricetes sp.]